MVLCASAGFAAEFSVADSGAKGDGQTDDGPAIRRAVAAALATGAGSRVVFEKKTYRLDWFKSAQHQIELVGAKDITLEGTGPCW